MEGRQQAGPELMARYLVTFLPGNPIPTRTKWIDDAVGPPDANVDAGTDGVAFGSILWDGTDLWFCVDPTTAAAVWVQINGGGSSSGASTLLVDLTVTGANDVDGNDAATHDLTLVGNSTLTPIHSDPPTGEAVDLRILIRQDGTGGRTLAWGGTIAWAGGTAPTMPTAANALLTVGLLSVDDGATWLGYAGGVDLSAIDFLVGTASGALSGEIVVGATPGGELGGTWASPTVDTVHSGSSHASAIATSGAVGPLLIADIHSTPIVFGDLLLTEDEDDLLYADA